MKRPAKMRQRRKGTATVTRSEIMTQEVLFDDSGGGPRGRLVRMTANVEGREFTAELYDPFTAEDAERHFLTLCVTPVKGEEANLGLYLTPAQINALAGIFASARDRVR